MNNQLIAPVTDEELDQMIWKLERDGGMVPKMLSLMKELREVRKAKREPVADVVAWSSPNEERICDIRWRRFDVAPGPLYSAPPAPVVPTFDEWLEVRGNKPLGWVRDSMREAYDACRAGMCATDKASNHAAFHGKCSENCATAPEQSGTTHAQEPVQSVVTVSDTWIPVSERMPDPKSEARVCVYTPTPHEDLRYRFVPASLFKTVCRDASHWYYMTDPAAPQE